MVGVKAVQRVESQGESGLRNRKLFIVIFLVLLISIYAMNLLATVPQRYDQYFALYTLGAAGTAEHYFPGDSANIFPGVRVSWFISVYDHMGSVELVNVVFRLLNESMLGPNQLNMTPGERPPFYESMRLLLPNETWTLPIVWSVSNATASGQAITIQSIQINGDVLSENVGTTAAGGHNFRIVIELWVFNETTGTFAFQWTANDEARVAWNQIWFNMPGIGVPGT
jgi:hypothetical protein